EDEEGVRRLIRQVLQRAGYTVLTAGSGEEALQRCAGHRGPLHLVLTDVVLPQMSGRELVERVQARYPGVRVLYMSGYTDNVVAQRGVLKPGTPFLQKPFTPDTLVRKVREALDTPP
ncbi:MAG: response regulator, partial [Nitrospinota bacterium]